MMKRSTLFVLTATFTALGTATAPSFALQTPSGQARPLDVTLDLAAPNRAAAVLSIPARQLFIVRLDNRAGAGAYRYSKDAPETPPAHWETLATPPMPINLLHPSPDCEANRQALVALSTAEREPLVPRLVAEYKRVVAEHPCLELDRDIGLNIAGRTMAGIVGAFLEPGQRMKVTVERVNPAPGDPSRWEIVVAAQGGAESQGRPQGQAQASALPWKYATESDWIVGEIASDLAAMAASSKGAPLPSAADVTRQGDGTFTVTVAGQGPPAPVTATIAPATYVWDPEVYVDLARRLLGAPARTAPTGASHHDALTNPTPETIAAEDLRVSAELSRNVRDPEAHEHAALVLAALALRKPSDAFTDNRPTLSRMSAHLAAAHALRGSAPAPPIATVAQATLLALAGRQVDALAALDRLSAGTGLDPSWAAWSRALRLRVTGDWRSDEKAETTLLERRERFRALQERLGDDAAMQFLERVRPDPSADWGRILLTHPTVEVANTFAPRQVAIELDEAARVWKAYHAGGLSPNQLLADLSVPRRRCVAVVSGKPEVAVVGWAGWALVLRRQVLAAADAEVRALAENLGSRAEAARAAMSQDGQLGTLRDFWMVRVARPSLESGNARSAPPPLPAQECSAIASALGDQPEAVGPSAWSSAWSRCPAGPSTGGLPEVWRWFNVLFPPGTSYDAAVRLTSALPPLDPASLSVLHRQASYDRALSRMAAARPYGQDVTLDELKAAYGPLMDYDLAALRSCVALVKQGGGDPADLYTRMCRLDATECALAGSYFAANERNEEALRAFERAFAEARDRVTVSNEIDWLVDYYLDHGRGEDAQRVATAAGDVGSEAGLRTRGRLMERQRRFDDAVTWYRRAEQRYEGDTSLQEFLVRHARRASDGRFAAEARAAMALLFPEGLQTVAAGDLPSPPRREGFRIDASVMSESQSRLGLRGGDVVMAVDGIRVRNANQWSAVRSLRDDPRLSLIVLRGGRYLEVAGPYVRKKFGP